MDEKQGYTRELGLNALFSRHLWTSYFYLSSPSYSQINLTVFMCQKESVGHFPWRFIPRGFIQKTEQKIHWKLLLKDGFFGVVLRLTSV